MGTKRIRAGFSVMKKYLSSFILLALMISASAFAVALKPTHRLADDRGAIDLKKILPEQFGDWREERQSSAVIVDPETKELLDKIYSQTVSRTYVNSKGYRIMLSLAYGGDQSTDMQVHRPEVCYAAQGFAIGNKQKVEILADGSSIPAMRLDTSLGPRVEPVTYWLRVGEKLVRGNIELGFARLSYGLHGQIADGLLFRVSSIDRDSPGAFVQQDKFIDDLLKSMPAENRRAVVGGLLQKS